MNSVLSWEIPSFDRLMSCMISTVRESRLDRPILILREVLSTSLRVRTVKFVEYQAVYMGEIRVQRVRKVLLQFRDGWAPYLWVAPLGGH